MLIFLDSKSRIMSKIRSLNQPDPGGRGGKYHPKPTDKPAMPKPKKPKTRKAGRVKNK
jgi:hypothetical protein